MGRTATTPPEIIEDTLTLDDVAGIAAANSLIIREECEKKRLLELLDDGAPFDLTRYEQKLHYHLNRSAEELVEAAKAMLVIKLNVSKDEWNLVVLRLNIPKRLIYRMLQTATKFGNPALKNIIKKTGNKSKIFEMLALEDEELIKIAENREDAIIPLDDLEVLNAKELRARIKEAKNKETIIEEQLREKDNEITELRTKLLQAKNPEIFEKKEIAERVQNFNTIVDVHINSIYHSFYLFTQSIDDYAKEYLLYKELKESIAEKLKAAIEENFSYLGFRPEIYVDTVPWLRDQEELESEE